MKTEGVYIGDIKVSLGGRGEKGKGLEQIGTFALHFEIQIWEDQVEAVNQYNICTICNGQGMGAVRLCSKDEGARGLIHLACSRTNRSFSLERYEQTGGDRERRD